MVLLCFCIINTFLICNFHFEELALINDQPRQATIRAKGRLKLATLGKKAFVRLLGPVVDIIKRNAQNYNSIVDQNISIS
jgi:cAMP-dependent protein kinase regulator